MDFPEGKTIRPRGHIPVRIDIDGKRAAIVEVCFQDPKGKRWCTNLWVKRGQKGEKFVLGQ